SLRPPKTDARAAMGPHQGNRDVVFHLNKAHERIEDEQLHSALIEVQKPLRINPRSAQALCMKARISAALGAIDAARRDLKTAEQINPNDPEIHALRGKMFWLSDCNAAETVAAYER